MKPDHKIVRAKHGGMQKHVIEGTLLYTLAKTHIWAVWHKLLFGDSLAVSGWTWRDSKEWSSGNLAGIRSICELTWCGGQQWSLGAKPFACSCWARWTQRLEYPASWSRCQAGPQSSGGEGSGSAAPPSLAATPTASLHPCLPAQGGDTGFNLAVQSIALALSFFFVVRVPFFFLFVHGHKFTCIASPACGKVTVWTVAEQCSD